MDRCNMERVASIEQVYELAEQRRSVYWWPVRALPAAVVLNWQAGHLARIIKRGDLYIYPRRLRKAPERISLVLDNLCFTGEFMQAAEFCIKGMITSAVQPWPFKRGDNVCLVMERDLECLLTGGKAK